MMDLVSNFLNRITRLGIDTAPFIYFIEKNPKYYQTIKQIFKKLDRENFVAYSSVITLTEVLIQPFISGKKEIARMYQDILLQSRNFTVVEINPEISIKAAELRAKYSLRTPDALQIAAVLSVNCEAFLTNDKSLRKVKEIEVLILDELI